MMTDPIADMLTRIRNGIHAKKGHVDMPASRIKAQIAKILLDGGYIRNVKYIDDGLQGKIRIYIKYAPDSSSVIEGIKRVSMPSRRVYVSKGYGTAVISTSKGVMTDKECRKLGVGGEVICHIW